MTIDDRPWEAEYYEIINSHREYHLPEEEEDEIKVDIPTVDLEDEVRMESREA